MPLASSLFLKLNFCRQNKVLISIYYERAKLVNAQKKENRINDLTKNTNIYMIGLRPLYTSNVDKRVCEGCFCDGAMWRAKGDHNVDLRLEKRESNSKFNRGPKVQPKG